MNTLKKSCVAVVVVIIASVFLSGAVVCLVGCSKQNGATWNSPYSVDYKITSDNFNAGIEITVKGPAAKLAVILTDPKGESDTQIIEKEQMISNRQTQEISMQDPQEGTYVLTVKTVDPEKVVWQKNIPLVLGKLTVEDVTFDLVPNMGQFVGYQLNGIKLVLKKDGSLPVNFTEASVAVDDKECNITSSIQPSIMVDQQQAVKIGVNCLPTPKMESRDRARGELPFLMALFQPGERHVVKGTLSFGKDHKSLEFEKEFVVSGNSTQGTKPTSAQEAKKDEKHYTGDIKAVDAANGIITVTKEGVVKDFTVGEKTKIATADKKAATLADLKVGDKVRVTYTEKAGKITVTTIAPPPKPKISKAE